MRRGQTSRRDRATVHTCQKSFVGSSNACYRSPSAIPCRIPRQSSSRFEHLLPRPPSSTLHPHSLARQSQWHRCSRCAGVPLPANTRTTAPTTPKPFPSCHPLPLQRLQTAGRWTSLRPRRWGRPQYTHPSIRNDQTKLRQLHSMSSNKVSCSLRSPSMAAAVDSQSELLLRHSNQKSSRQLSSINYTSMLYKC